MTKRLSWRAGARRARLGWQALLRGRRGATAVEYGLIVGLIVIVMVVTLKDVGNTTSSMWGNVNGKIANATGN